MVLGLRTKNRKGTSVQVDYIIHIQEIKPWPPSQSLRSLRSVVLLWENGDRNSGTTNTVVPTIGSLVGEGKIEFNESIKLTVTLSRDASVRGGDGSAFQKNFLDLNLYEPRRDRTLKGQHLGSASIDLAEYCIVKESVTVSVPVNCKRSFRNTAQPVLFVKIQPSAKDGNSVSSRESLSKEASLEKDGRESISALMNEEYANEAEIASFTDDDVSSHSSLTVSSSAFENSAGSPSQNDNMGNKKLQEENASVGGEKRESGNEVSDSPSETVPSKSALEPLANQTFSLHNRSPSLGSSRNLSSEPGSPHQDDATSSDFPERNRPRNVKKPVPGTDRNGLAQEIKEMVTETRNEMKRDAGNPTKNENRTNGIGGRVENSDSDLQVRENQTPVIPGKAEGNAKEDGKTWRENGSAEAMRTTGASQTVTEEKDEDKHVENGQETKLHSSENGHLVNHHSDSMTGNQQLRVSQDILRKSVTSVSDMPALSRRGFGGRSNAFTTDRLNNMKFSVRSSLDSAGSITSLSDNQLMEEVKEIDMLKDVRNDTRSIITDIGKDGQGRRSLGIDKVRNISRETQDNSSNIKVRQLEHRIEMLEGELREAAAVELGLYSIIAEHGSSVQKVHAPARRLSRLYLHALKHWSRRRRASVARSAASGLVLVAKACGNDVPRLTFWLSNSVVLRAIITQAVGDSQLPIASGPHVGTNDSGKKTESKSFPLKWKESLLNNRKERKSALSLNFCDWDEPHTFTSALERIEAWIFSRVIESVWWQTLTPQMQSATEDGSEQKTALPSRKSYERKHSLGDQWRGNFSIDLWKKAFRDACERICPVRHAGHECGCLPFLARLVMEQCVARLDVAMFNAILRESDDDIPTDPVSDPISDPKVLPIPSGKSSFGAGALLKNAIGNWSRWLTDLFGIDEDDSRGNENGHDDDRQDAVTSFKAFYLLNALSDLFMLPKDMLLDESIRKEVCPTFGAPLIKRILDTFVPDEFCPDPIPEAVFEALDSEGSLEDGDEGSIRNFPCNATSIIYSPPTAALVTSIIGDLGSRSQLRRTGSSVLRKGQTSDDELDELDSPLTSIIIDNRSPTSTTASWLSKGNNGDNAVRYQLLREVWRDGD